MPAPDTPLENSGGSRSSSHVELRSDFRSLRAARPVDDAIGAANLRDFVVDELNRKFATQTIAMLVGLAAVLLVCAWTIALAIATR